MGALPSGLLNREVSARSGAHAGASMTPVIEEITEARKVAWCGCKHSGKGAFYDSGHAKLPESLRAPHRVQGAAPPNA